MTRGLILLSMLLVAWPVAAVSPAKYQAATCIVACGQTAPRAQLRACRREGVEATCTPPTTLPPSTCETTTTVTTTTGTTDLGCGLVQATVHHLLIPSGGVSVSGRFFAGTCATRRFAGEAPDVSETVTVTGDCTGILDVRDVGEGGTARGVLTCACCPWPVSVF